MNNNRITTQQMISVMIMFIFGSLVVTGSFAAGQDSWVSILLSVLIIAPFFFLYGRILKLFPGSNFFDICINLFGKIFGKLILVFYLSYTLILGGFVIRTFSEFIKIVAMPETPQLLVQAFMIPVCIWIAKSGIETIARVCRFVIPFIMLAILFTLVISSTSMDIKNLFPILGTSFKKIILTSVIRATLPLGELVLLGAIFSSYDKQKSPIKPFMIALLIGSAAILIGNLRNVLVLGVPSIDTYYYPSYESVSIASLGEIFTRVEVLIGVIYTLAGSLKFSICIYISSLAFSKISNYDDMRVFSAPSAFIMLFIGNIAAKNSSAFYNIMFLYPFFALPYQAILPVIIFIAAEIKTKTQKKSNSLQNKGN